MMRRRRPFRPLARPILKARRMAGRTPLPPQLQHANQLYQTGKYAEAAMLYEDLFDSAEQRNFPQAPKLLMQAGFAWLKANESNKGMDAFKKGFSIWIERKQWQALQKASRVTYSRLKREGYKNEAASLESWMNTRIPVEIKNTDAWQAEPHTPSISSQVDLPAVCPQCGAPVDPKNVEWFNDQIGQCPFCNAILTSSQ